MTLAHFIYIPGVLIFGIVVGYVLGGRAVQMAQAEQEDKAQRRQARDAARRARDRATREATPD